MASPSVVDVEAILSPISEETPGGEVLDRSSPSLDAIVTIRDRSKTSERKLREKIALGEEGDGEQIPEPMWGELIKLSAELLIKESKDLRVAAWMLEGLMREQGFQGLRDGIKVCAGLCSEAFWPSIRPVPDELDGHEMTVAQLGGVTGDASVGAVNEIPVTNAPDAVYTMNDYVDASEMDKLDPAAREKKVQEGHVSFAEFEKGIRNTPATFYQDLIADLAESIESLNSMSDFLDANCTKNQYDEITAPSVLPLRNRLKDVHELISGLAREHLAAAEQEGEVEGDGEQVGPEGTAVITTNQVAAAPAVTVGSAKVIDRDDAFKALGKIADFFESTEPHSPIAHQIRQAVNWGRMSYGELMSELIKDKNALDALYLRVGVSENSDG